MDKAVPVDPICPRCRMAVLPGDHVYFGHGDLIHLNCHLQQGDVSESLANLLKRNAGVAHCQNCLARLLHTTAEQMTKAVTTLRRRARYRVSAIGACSVCSTPGLTVRAEPPVTGES